MCQSDEERHTVQVPDRADPAWLQHGGLPAFRYCCCWTLDEFKATHLFRLYVFFPPTWMFNWFPTTAMLKARSAAGLVKYRPTLRICLCMLWRASIQATSCAQPHSLGEILHRQKHVLNWLLDDKIACWLANRCESLQVVLFVESNTVLDVFSEIRAQG